MEKSINKIPKHSPKLNLPTLLGPAVAAKKRRLPASQTKVHTVMKEFKRGALRSGSGEMVTKRPQAIAIAMSEAKKKKNMAAKKMPSYKNA